MSSTAKKEPFGRSKFPVKGKTPSGKENAHPSARARSRKLSNAHCEKRSEETISRRRFSLTVDEQKNESVGSSHATDVVGISNGFPVKKTPFRIHCDQKTDEVGKRKPLPRRGVAKQGTSSLEPTINTRNRRDDGQKLSLPRPAPTTKSSTIKGLQSRSQIPLLVDAKESQNKRRSRSTSTAKPNLDIHKGASRFRSMSTSAQTSRRSASVSRLPVRVDRPLRRFASDDIARIQSSKTSSTRPRQDDCLAKKSCGSPDVKPKASLVKDSVTRSTATPFNDKPPTQSNSLRSFSKSLHEGPKSIRKRWFVEPPSAIEVTKPKVSLMSSELPGDRSRGSYSNISCIETSSKRVRIDTPGIVASYLQVDLNRQDSQIPGSQSSIGSQSVTVPAQADVSIPAAASRPITLAVENDENEIRMRKRTRSREYDQELFFSELIQHAEYHEDLPITELEKEILLPPLSNNFLLGDVNPEQRNLIVNFLIHLGVHCQYPSFVIYQTVKLFDIVLDKIPMETVYIQLAAFATLWIVIKRHMNIHKIPSATKMLALAKGLYEDREDMLINFERKILEEVKFNLSCADPFSLLGYHLINCNRHFDIPDQQMTIIYNCGSYLIDLSLLYDQFCRVSSSLIAFSAAELVLCVTLDNINAKVRSRWAFWRVFLRGASSQPNRFQDKEIAALRVALIRHVRCSGTKQSLSNTVYKKYKRSKYGRISDFFLEQIKNIPSIELLDP